MEIKGLRKPITRVDPYVYGVDVYEKALEDMQTQSPPVEMVKIGSNENNYGPYPHTLKAMQAELGRLHRYPDVKFNQIKRLLSQVHGIPPEYFSMSHGAEGMLQTIGKCFIEEGDEIIIPAATYGLYRSISTLMGGRVVNTPMKNFCIDLKAVQASLTPQTKLIWLANPNNPTGTVFPKNEFGDLLAALPDTTWVVLDEAYAEFAPAHELPDRATLLAQEQRLIAIRTFSKAYGLAGARLGYAMAHPDMVTVIDTVSEPFNANRVGIAGGIAALSEDRAIAEKTLATMIADRGRMETALKKMHLKVVPSRANFIFFETPMDGQDLTMTLFRKGFIVRPCKAWGYDRAIRVTVGTSEQVDRFLETLGEILKAI